MSDNKSFSNLILWGKQLKSISENFELIHLTNLDDITPYLKDQKAKVLVIHASVLKSEEIKSLFLQLEAQSQKTEVIAILEGMNSITRNILISALNPAAVFETHEMQTQDVEKAILSAIRKYDYHQQNHNFYLLFQEQGEKLLELNTELEERILLKNTSLKRSQSRLLSIQKQLNLMYECIIGIQNSKSIPDIEDFLTETLTQFFEVNWVRILVGQKEIYNETFIIEGQKKYKIFGTPLYFGKKSIGHIYFAKLNPSFKKKDEAFLLQLSEIVSIKINQITNYSDLLVTRSQWQQTFKAIKHQVTIVDSGFNLLNNNFSSHQSSQKCYELLFDADKPCENCHLGKKFQLQKKEEWFNITSQKIKTQDQKLETYINIYQNVTEQKTIELKILEKTKLSDLGILAGSLAHELNNPLAGIITFLQLILSDPENTPKDTITDIEDLLTAALDCKHVIESILESVRNNQSLDL
jgi:hypothetical protein